MDEHRLASFENKVKRKIFGTKVKGGKKLYSEQLRDLFT
jgi:hypothetical protein